MICVKIPFFITDENLITLISKELNQIDDFPATMVASMVHDLTGGKPMELDWISGAVCRFGREVGVPTPTHDAFFAALKPYKDGA